MDPSAMISFTSLSFGFLKKLRSERQKKSPLGEEGSRNRDGGFDRAPRLEDAASICPSAWYQQWSCFIMLFLTCFVP
jgi:hypothetical protein